MDFDFFRTPYARSRQPVFAKRGIVATGQPLAAQAGLRLLQAGGNAVDAIVATAAALTVLEPTSNGIGGDAFALLWDGQQLIGLNGSGRSPAAASHEALNRAGYQEMPAWGWWPVTAPGAPAAWRDLHTRFGRLPPEQILAPAIQYAEEGYPVSPMIAQAWNRAAQRFLPLAHQAAFTGWATTFAPGGQAPRTGEVWASPDHATTLRRLAADWDDFYTGRLAQQIADFAAATGGLLTREDLRDHRSEWVTPILQPFRGYTIAELPPNGQGLAALIALGILDGVDLHRYPRDSATALHLQIEAMKLAFADAGAYIGDPQHTLAPVAGLLNPDYLAERRALVGSRASQPVAGRPPSGGTVYLCAADSDGMMVSYIQSNYMGFGSGIVVPGTGIALHNRGHNFSLISGHPNAFAPRKRPYHTIIPGFLLHAGQAIGPFGVMGGFMQPQGHVQVLVNTLDYGLHPQAALDVPRWRWDAGNQIALENGFPAEAVQELERQGHECRVEAEPGGFGRGQIIWRLPNGVYIAGSDTRTDGAAVGW